MSTKRKEGKRKKQASPPRAPQHYAHNEDHGEVEVEAAFPDMYEKVCKELGVKNIPKIINAEPFAEEEDAEEEDTKKVTKKKGKRAPKGSASRSDSSPPHAPSSGAASTGGSTGIIAATTDDTFTTGEALNADEEAASGEPPRPIPVRPPSLRVFYYDTKKATIPQALSFEGVQLQDKLILALEKCLPIYSSISSLAFKKCDLSGDMVLRLADVLRCSEHIKELTIDDCPHPQQNYYALVRDGRYLELLILRGCRINDEGARMIAFELAYKEDFKDTTTLFYLNLSVNMIGDRGARHLAKALRTNRTLLALTLTANLITDIGAIALGNVLKDFELSEDEVLDRRQHIYHRFKAYLEIKEELMEELKASKALEAAELKPNQDHSEAPRVPKKKKEKHRARKYKDPLSIETHLEIWRQTQSCELPGFDHPFTSDVFKSERKLWSRGNLRLTHLNLSYNAITSLGAEKFLQVISYQARVKRVSPKLAQTGFTGLTNLILQGNLFPIHCPEMMQIHAYITNPSEVDIRRSDQSILGEAPQSAEKSAHNKGPLPLYSFSTYSTADAGTQCAF